MNRITLKFRQLKSSGEKAFIPFITAGYPNMTQTVEIVSVLEQTGADIIEIGMPFSDPLADGPTIQASSHESIMNGTTPESVFECISKIREKSEIPVILFTYTNLILHFGIEKFMTALSDSGGDGLLVPDLPVEESKDFRKCAKKHKIRMIFLISPLTSVERMKQIERASDDFVYCVSIAGVTGARNALFEQIKPYLETVRNTISKPFVVGFGVSSGSDAADISSMSDGVVVGSAIIKIIQKYKENLNLINHLRDFASEIHQGLKSNRKQL